MQILERKAFNAVFFKVVLKIRRDYYGRKSLGLTPVKKLGLTSIPEAFAGRRV